MRVPTPPSLGRSHQWYSPTIRTFSTELSPARRMNRAALLLDDAHNANGEYDWLLQSDPRKRLVRGIHPNLLAEAATSSRWGWIDGRQHGFQASSQLISCCCGFNLLRFHNKYSRRMNQHLSENTPAVFIRTHFRIQSTEAQCCHCGKKVNQEHVFTYVYC